MVARNDKKDTWPAYRIAIKERPVTEANNEVRRSLASATGMCETLKELKDCLRDKLPDDNQ